MIGRAFAVRIPTVVALIVLAAAMVMPALPAAAAPQTLAYEVQHPTYGKIGTMTNTIEKSGEQTTVTTDGRIPASIKIPQCCWMPCRPKPDKTLEGAMAIFCFTEKERDLLQARYGTGVLVHPAADEQVTPLSPEEREKVKGEMADGKEYFLTDITGAAPSEVVNLLKAFSLFKKRQLSNMKLVLAGKGDPTLAGKLGSYKYRQDVCRHPGPPADHWQRLAGAAYAIICLFRKDDLGIALLNSWKAGVPVIASSTGCIHEPGEAVLLVPEGDPAPLADGRNFRRRACIPRERLPHLPTSSYAG